MRKLLVLGCFLIVTPAFADLWNVSLEGGPFDYSVSGNVRDSSNPAETIDVNSQLGWEGDTEMMGYLYVKHPIPIIPNFRLGVTNLKLGGTNTLTSDIIYNGVTYPAGSTVTSSIDLSHTELALYYNLLDTFMSIDLGLNFKKFDGQFQISDNLGNRTTTTYNETLPMLYGAIGVPIPGTGFSVGGDLSWTSYQDSKMSDLLVRVRYDTDFFLGVELGYRSFHIDYQNTDDNEYAKLDVTGPYLMARLVF